MIKSEKKYLLEDLREETGALYISDLRHSPYHELAIQMLAKKRGGGIRYRSGMKHWNTCCFMRGVLPS